MSLPHTLNLFDLDFKGSQSFTLQPFSVTEDYVEEGERRLPLEELAFQLRLKLKVPVLSHRSRLLAFRRDPSIQGRVLTVGSRSFTLKTEAPITATFTDPEYAHILQQMVSMFLREHLTSEAHQFWTRGQNTYCDRKLIPLNQGRAFYAESFHIEVVLLDAQKPVLAIDRRIVPIGPALSTLSRARCEEILFHNPYEPEQEAEDDEGQLAESSAEPDAPLLTRRERNFILVDPGLGGHPRRVYVDRGRTKAESFSTVWVSHLHASHPESNPISCDLSHLHPVLAPQEIDFALGRGWRRELKLTPAMRMACQLELVQTHLRRVRIFQVEAEVKQLLPDQMPEVSAFEWPEFSMGTLPQGIRYSQSQFLVEHRWKGLRAYGPRVIPTDVTALEVVGIEGLESDAKQLLDAVQVFLKAHHLENIQARLCPISLTRRLDASALTSVRNHYEKRKPAERPAMVLVMKDGEGTESRTEKSLYHAIQYMGDALDLPVKVSMLRTFREHERGGEKKLESYISNVLPSLLCRAGVVLWGLHENASRPGLVHDFCVGLDVGGRDRTSSRSGNDTALAFTIAGDNRPAFWWPKESARLQSDKELPSEETLEYLLLDAARALRPYYQRHWLYLRDGNLPDEEWERLHTLIDVAEAEGLRSADHAVTVVEVHKSHPFRIPALENGKWSPSEAGMYAWLMREQETVVGTQHHRLKMSDAVLTTTGRPWNIQGTPHPLRCRIYTLRGPVLHAEALEDLWRLAHMNQSAPHIHTKLPLPLHQAQKMGKDLLDGKSLKSGGF